MPFQKPQRGGKKIAQGETLGVVTHHQRPLKGGKEADGIQYFRHFFSDPGGIAAMNEPPQYYHGHSSKIAAPPATAAPNPASVHFRNCPVPSTAAKPALKTRFANPPSRITRHPVFVSTSPDATIPDVESVIASMSVSPEIAATP